MKKHKTIIALEKVLDLCKEGKLPDTAKEWSESALETATSIINTITDMKENKVLPTPSQKSALENICKGAEKWIEGSKFKKKKK